MTPPRPPIPFSHHFNLALCKAFTLPGGRWRFFSAQAQLLIKGWLDNTGLSRLLPGKPKPLCLRGADGKRAPDSPTAPHPCGGSPGVGTPSNSPSASSLLQPPDQSHLFQVQGHLSVPGTGEHGRLSRSREPSSPPEILAFRASPAQITEAPAGRGAPCKGSPCPLRPSPRKHVCLDAGSTHLFCATPACAPARCAPCSAILNAGRPCLCTPPRAVRSWPS